jgi:hypothetical protein
MEETYQVHSLRKLADGETVVTCYGDKLTLKETLQLRIDYPTRKLSVKKNG